MLLAGEVKGELARIQPARACCRRAQLAGLLYGADERGVRTLDHATARVALQLAAAAGVPLRASNLAPHATGDPGRHHLEVALDASAADGWSWEAAAACDRRAWLRGLLLARASLSLGHHGPHVEWTLRDRRHAGELRRRLAELEVRAAIAPRRGRQIVYVKGQEEIATLLRLTGANRALLDFETARVGRDVQNRLNRLLNAEEANLGRTVHAAERQLQAIAALERSGKLATLSQELRATAMARRQQPDADLDTLAESLGVSRSAVNHRLRRLVRLARDEDGPAD